MPMKKRAYHHMNLNSVKKIDWKMRMMKKMRIIKI
jgi:hypothetical protein